MAYAPTSENRTPQPHDYAFALSQVTKVYGDKPALAELSLAVPPGSVVGLIGRNGAGKSTAIRCLLGLEPVTAGAAWVFGEPSLQLSVAAKQRLGAMVDGGLPFVGSTAAQLFDFCAPLYPRWDVRIEQRLCQRFSIDVGKKIGTLSLGQQRAVALALALCPRPDLLVLDEPAANLDPVMRREFLSEVLALIAADAGEGQALGRTVLFSSHNLSDVERIADRVVLLHEGRVRLDRPLEQLRESVRRLRLVFPREVPAQIATIPGTLAVQVEGRELLVTVDGFDPRSLPGIAQATGAHVEVLNVGLEELFLDLSRAAGDRRAA